VQLAVTVQVRGTNGQGVQGGPQVFSYSCPSRGDCFPALSAARAVARLAR